MRFSPRTSRLPFGNRSATVTVMLPSSLLLWLESDLPSNDLSPESSLLSSGAPLKVMPRPAMVGVSAATLPVLAVAVLDSFDASVFSTSSTCRMSPTARARRSMNRPKPLAGLKIVPSSAGGALYVSTGGA